VFGIPADLPVDLFVDATLIQVCLGQHQISLHFAPERSIGIEGRWELRDTEGNIIDATVPHESRKSYQIHRIIGQDVKSGEVNPPHSFTLHFRNEFDLTVYDDSQEYESFSIQPGDIFI